MDILVWRGSVKEAPVAVLRKAMGAAGQAGLPPKATEQDGFVAERGRSFNLVVMIILILFFLLPGVIYYFASPVNRVEVEAEAKQGEGSSVKISATGDRGRSALAILAAALTPAEGEDAARSPA
ncbi:MAG: hypothetical protein JRN39_04740 [Nitrososphaerota archaeon]|nr:hypothetical protein [Nitrososphaerota archaeon]